MIRLIAIAFVLAAATKSATASSPDVYRHRDAGLVYGTNWSGARTTDATGKTVTLSNGAAITAGGKTLSLDGVDDFGTVGDDSSLSFTDGSGQDLPCSIVVWVYANDWLNNGQQAVCKLKDSAPSAYEWFVRASTTAGASGKPMFAVFNSTASASITAVSSIALPAASWTCIGISYSGSESPAGIKLFINGVEDTGATKASSGSYTGMSNTTAPLLIGSRSTGEFLKGKIGTIKIYSGRVLNPGEFAQEYNRGKAAQANGGTP